MSQAPKPSITILNHLRWLAALMVAYSHVRQNILIDHSDVPHPGLFDQVMFFFDAYGHAGVIIFFVLSGFLVGGKAITLLESKSIATEWPHFLADRFSRIFVVLWPALLLCLALLRLLHGLAPNAPFMTSGDWGWAMQYPLNGDFSIFRWVNAALLLNQFNAITPNINSPLWSLAYEWLYYMAALGIVLVVRRVFSRASLLVIGYAATLFIWALVFNHLCLVYGCIWLLGVGSGFVFNRSWLTSEALWRVGIAAFFIAFFLARWGLSKDFLLGSVVAFMIANRNWAEWRYFERLGKELASFSYSFYLVHFPFTVLVLGLLFHFGHLRHRLPPDANGIGIAAATLLGAGFFAKLFALCTEDRTPLVRRWLWRSPAGRADSLPGRSG
jgi:peptidoglycan/LPS O-acetylase OafA/YrhL